MEKADGISFKIFCNISISQSFASAVAARSLPLTWLHLLSASSQPKLHIAHTKSCSCSCSCSLGDGSNQEEGKTILGPIAAHKSQRSMSEAIYVWLRLLLHTTRLELRLQEQLVHNKCSNSINKWMNGAGLGTPAGGDANACHFDSCKSSTKQCLTSCGANYGRRPDN